MHPDTWGDDFVLFQVAVVKSSLRMSSIPSLSSESFCYITYNVFKPLSTSRGIYSTSKMHGLTATTRLQLYPETQVISACDSHIFFSPTNHRWVKVNEDGRLILESFRTEQIYGQWVDNHANGNDAVRSNLSTFISSQVHNGILQADGIRETVNWSEAVGAQTLQKVYFEITSRCNLNCSYCFNSWSRSNTQASLRPTMSRKDWYRLADELKEMAVEEIVITGGEPLLNTWVPEFGRHIRSAGIQTTLLTNGTLITDSLAHRSIDGFDRINVSLDSSQERLHDAARGSGSFKKVLGGIKALKRAGHQTIILKPTLSTHNIEHFEDLPCFAKQELDCYLYTPTLCLPFRDSEGNIDKSYTPERDRLLQTLESFTINFEYYYHANERPAVQIGPHVSCGLGKRILSVDIHGDVYPCQALHDPDLVCGNVFENSIKDIHSNSEVTNRLGRLSTLDIETCGECAWALLCSGGCRAFAYNLHRDIKAFNSEFCEVLLDSAQKRLIDFANQQ